MDKEKQIEARHEISGIIYDCIRESNGNFTVPMLSRRITQAGYGNVKQYEAEIERLQIELAHREEDLVHADEKVFYRECDVASRERDVVLQEEDIKKQAVKDFAKKLRDNLSERISTLNAREEECIEAGDWESAARCNACHEESERVLQVSSTLIKELNGENNNES